MALEVYGRWRARRCLRHLPVVGTAAAIALVIAACGSAPSTHGAEPHGALRSDPFGRRYCEVILVGAGRSGLTGAVYNSYPLNACPESEWSKLDARSLSSANGALLAELNGPRYWLMDAITKQRSGAEVIKDFGGIRMIEEATVSVGSASAQTYTPHRVDRQTVFTFDAGRTIHELIDPSGQRWVMQTWSQAVDPSLQLADLGGLGPRLELPPGWRYQLRQLTAPLRVDTTTTSAEVLQDTLQDSYSLEAAATSGSK